MDAEDMALTPLMREMLLSMGLAVTTACSIYAPETQDWKSFVAGIAIGWSVTDFVLFEIF